MVLPDPLEIPIGEIVDTPHIHVVFEVCELDLAGDPVGGRARQANAEDVTLATVISIGL